MIQRNQSSTLTSTLNKVPSKTQLSATISQPALSASSIQIHINYRLSSTRSKLSSVTSNPQRTLKPSRAYGDDDGRSRMLLCWIAELRPLHHSWKERDAIPCSSRVSASACENFVWLFCMGQFSRVMGNLKDELIMSLRLVITAMAFEFSPWLKFTFSSSPSSTSLTNHRVASRPRSSRSGWGVKDTIPFENENFALCWVGNNRRYHNVSVWVDIDLEKFPRDFQITIGEF